MSQTKIPFASVSDKAFGRGIQLFIAVLCAAGLIAAQCIMDVDPWPAPEREPAPPPSAPVGAR